MRHGVLELPTVGLTRRGFLNSPSPCWARRCSPHASALRRDPVCPTGSSDHANPLPIALSPPGDECSRMLELPLSPKPRRGLSCGDKYH